MNSFSSASHVLMPVLSLRYLFDSFCCFTVAKYGPLYMILKRRKENHFVVKSNQLSNTEKSTLQCVLKSVNVRFECCVLVQGFYRSDLSFSSFGASCGRWQGDRVVVPEQFVQCARARCPLGRYCCHLAVLPDRRFRVWSDSRFGCTCQNNIHMNDRT